MRGISPLSPQSSVLGPHFAFTLIELLVVIGVVAILVGVLLPLVSKMYRTSQIVAMKSNFQTIEGALENYKTDFGSYPKNGYALSDPTPTAIYNYTSYTSGEQLDVYRPALPRTDPTLAMALIGPGPASAMTMSNNVVSSTYYPNGDVDGNDGPGFKTQMALVGSVTGTASPSASPPFVINVTLSASQLTNANNPLLPPFTVVSLGGPGSPDAHLQVVNFTSSTITVATPIQGNYSAGVTVGLLAPTGKTWGPYLPVERFKVSYVFIPSPGSSPATPMYPYEPIPLPVLLDIWGNPIIYMPAYNTFTNHSTNSGVLAAAPNSSNPTNAFPLLGAPTPVTYSVGPLLGWPTTAMCQYNTAMNTATITNSPTGPAVFWSGPLNYLTTGQVAALLYKLGDRDGNNAINDGESLAVQKPYFLMSSGPDGQFLDLYPGVSTPPSGSNAYWQTLVQKSDDVYSFDQ